MSLLCKLSLDQRRSIQVIPIMDTSCSTRASAPVTRVKKTALDLRWLGISNHLDFRISSVLCLLFFFFSFLFFPLFQPVGRAVKYQ